MKSTLPKCCGVWRALRAASLVLSLVSIRRNNASSPAECATHTKIGIEIMLVIGTCEPLDLNIAQGRLMVAVPDTTDYKALVQRGRRLRVATKTLT